METLNHFFINKDTLPGWNFTQSVFAEVDSGHVSGDGCIPNIIWYAGGLFVTTAKYREASQIRTMKVQDSVRYRKSLKNSPQ